jgi:hypothetical protein
LTRQAEHFSDRSMAAGIAKIYDQVLAGTSLGLQNNKLGELIEPKEA